MEFSDLPIFFRRRFDENLFEDYLNFGMNFWIGDNFNDFKVFEINVINDTIENYFSDNYKIGVRGDIILSDYYKFVDFIVEKYKNKLRDFWDKY
jgi:hypothetical protein